MSRIGTAIVIGYKGANSTGLIRSLGEAGYDVVFASSYSCVESKYVTDYLYLPEEESEKINILCDYLKNTPSPVALFTGDDGNGMFLDNNWEKLSQLCYCPNAGGQLKTLSNKSHMASLARVCGLRIPETCTLALSKTKKCPITYPVILKPYAGYAGQKTDIQICRNESEYLSSIDYLMKHGYTNVLLQQFLEGTTIQDICLTGCSIYDGTVVIPCCILKIRSYPLQQGSLSYGQVRQILSSDDLSKLKSFIQKTGYVGIFDIDMMIVDGTSYFIEVNYRNGQNGYVSTSAGYNIPANWFKGMQGKSMDPERPLKPLYYMDEHCDYKHIFDGYISPREWINDFLQVSVFAMLNRKDMTPFVKQYVRLPEKWKRKIRSIVHTWRH